MTRLRILLVLLLPLVLAGCLEEEKMAAAVPPPEVDVAKPVTHKITEWEDFTGRFQAVDRVDIRARVTGYLLEKKFKDGQLVKKGDVLFVIDSRPFQYVLQRTETQYELAKKAYDRASKLTKNQTISEENFDERLQELKNSEAALKEAKLNLEFTEVKAPIDGKISDGFIDIGNLVRENETILTRIVSVDPIHFQFEASQGQLLKYLRLDRAGKRPSSDRAPNPIFVKLMDEKKFSHKGRMDFVDNIVDPGTGTIQGRALIENKDAIIYPGLFGRARLMGRNDFEAILLPEKAINTDQNKKFVYVVGEDDKTDRVYITPGSILENGLVIVEEGLKGNERVVVNGIQRIRAPKQPVKPVETKLEWKELESMPDVNLVPSLQSIQNGRQASADSPTKLTSE